VQALVELLVCAAYLIKCHPERNAVQPKDLLQHSQNLMVIMSKGAAKSLGGPSTMLRMTFKGYSKTF